MIDLFRHNKVISRASAKMLKILFSQTMSLVKKAINVKYVVHKFSIYHYKHG